MSANLREKYAKNMSRLGKLINKLEREIVDLNEEKTCTNCVICNETNQNIVDSCNEKILEIEKQISAKTISLIKTKSSFLSSKRVLSEL